MSQTLSGASNKARELYDRIRPELGEIRDWLKDEWVVLKIGEYAGYKARVTEVCFDFEHWRDGGVAVTVFVRIPMITRPDDYYWDRVDARSGYYLDQIELFKDYEGKVRNG